MDGFSHKAVERTVVEFPVEYEVQAGGRELNLFYLTDERRERIEMVNGEWSMVNSKGVFNAEEIKKELQDNPERFSPNVILRPVFQEMLLPNVAFIGGGGEIAYWLELKKVFEEINVPFPVLVLRNSFLLLSKEMNQLKEKLQLETKDLFKKDAELFNELVKRETKVPLSLEKEKQALAELYSQLINASGKVDPTLARHTDALQAKAMNKIDALEKKMLRAEKRKFEAAQRQLHKLKSLLFPHNNLQERIENILPFYAIWGKDIIRILYENSLGLEQQFCVILENNL